MKILFVNNFFNEFGGAEISMFRTAELIKKNGHEVFYFATDNKPYYDENYKYKDYFAVYRNYSDMNILERFFQLPKAFYNDEAEKKMTNLLKEIEPDVVHCNSIMYNLTPSVLNACYKENIPVVLTMHDSNLFCPAITLTKCNHFCDSKCYHGSTINCLINNCFQHNFQKSAISALEFAYRKHHKLYNKISHYVCPSKRIYEIAQKSKMSEDKLSIINHFIDTDTIKPNYANKGYFLYVGRLSREKGVNDLVEAMRDMPETELHIVGTGDEEQNIKNSIQKFNLTNIKLLGYKTGEDLENEYKHCIATILPSKWFEMFGLTIIESFANGKAVIGSNTGGITDIIDDNINGFIFESGNINKLAEKLKKFIDNPALSAQLGMNARMKAEKYYSPKVFCESLVNVYQKCVSNKLRQG